MRSHRWGSWRELENKLSDKVVQLIHDNTTNSEYSYYYILTLSHLEECVFLPYCSVFLCANCKCCVQGFSSIVSTSPLPPRTSESGTDFEKERWRKTRGIYILKSTFLFEFFSPFQLLLQQQSAVFQPFGT